MKAFFYPLLRKHFLVRMPEGRPYRSHIVYLLVNLLLLGQQTVQAQFGSDIGAPALSTLAWDHISSIGANYGAEYGSHSIGLTTDNRIYVWGSNTNYVITTQTGTLSGGTGAQWIPTPYFIPSPAGETPIKVRAIQSNASGPQFFCLTQSGKLYAWGINGTLNWSGYFSSQGLLSTAEYGSGWPLTTQGTVSTAQALRTPKLLKVSTETSVVDFDATTFDFFNYAVAIGASGKAYYIGGSASGTGVANGQASTFTAMPFPAGASASFKYTKVWLPIYASDISPYHKRIYLKGNDGNIYYTGAQLNQFNTGVAAFYDLASGTTDQTNGNVLNLVPVQVPFPVGEDIIKVLSDGRSKQSVTIAISASGKAYIAGAWKGTQSTVASAYYRNQYSAPLKSTPGSQLATVATPGAAYDSLYYLKTFTEVASLPGGAKIVDATANSKLDYLSNTLFVGDNGKVYWSGSNRDSGEPDDVSWMAGNFLSLTNSGPFVTPDLCNNIFQANAFVPYSWTYEAINYRGAAKLFQISQKEGANNGDVGIISKTGRGYFVGNMTANTGTGKIYPVGETIGFTISPYPVPIANELLLSCNTSPGTGGPLGEPVSTPGVGVIDCSKTKLYPAPVQGTPSELSLLVTINVTTVGDFAPITISGSGMSLVSGFDKVTATTTGVQTFHIPIKYDGTALTNAFQFTIGQAGSCSADLTNKPSNEITRVWSLNNCSAITPGVLSK
ncbi:hypothetical protein [Runella limosa]|uniref:hypothetical protein n=1 Tax=Runella limosa TaxID=370978 RepID=UPI000419CFF8|nr:hypothetical protein [Runella limosa]